MEAKPGQEDSRYGKVAVLMGGPSAERMVSLNSGRAVSKGLREAGYDVTEVDVTRAELRLPAGIEAVFIALHGEFGEDGQVQELLARRGVPFTGSGPSASRAAFDKRTSKKIFHDRDIPTAPYEIIASGAARSLPLPVVTKPLRQGSSLGVNRVFAQDQWDAAFADSRSYGDEVMVEAYVAGRELTVGIVGEDALPVIEIVAPDGNYSYVAKYTKGQTEYRVPAPIAKRLYRECQALALRTFEALDCRGFARVDFRLDPQGQLVVLELNSIPGFFTETSLLPKAAAQAGIGFAELCDRIMRMAGRPG